MAIALSTLLASSATAAAAGTTAAAAGGAAVAATAASSISFASMLSAGFGVASGLASIAQGVQQGRALEGQAEWDEFNASRELLKGRAESLDALRAGNEAVAQSQVAGFAGGLASDGSVATAKTRAMEDTAFKVGMSETNAQLNAGALRGKAAQGRQDASVARWSGAFSAAGRWGDTLDRFGRTG